MTVVNKTFMASPTLRATTGKISSRLRMVCCSNDMAFPPLTALTSGANYFEVRVVEVNLGGHIAFGLGNEEVYKNTAVLAPPQVSMMDAVRGA